ncbi:sensor histidine kinase [Ectothiorhodospira sp. BSL-9]|uniref:sensor histidine kinase n=1 Tax=Ectothiorhodospira sp. BSL-9 TaxID=1442136 RepID=UPI0007B42F11|nr:histidine kinase [Ectothiorhodospira sp. BSL-9]ANB01815.1 histidine kinase [Ectothiorhodospira sp. BSL-9]TVQ73757.1 MAG: sensor histidine kinase [Chromatiaceae bacterium]
MTVMPKHSRTGSTTSRRRAFLPDFCESRTVFVVVLMAQLLAFILALASEPRPQGFWVNLALTSLFVQWVALGTVFTLCLNRRWLRRLRPLNAAVAAWLIMLAVTLVLSVIAVQLSHHLGWYTLGSGFPVDEFLMRTLAVSAIVCAVALRYLYVQKQWQENVEAEARSRVQALQARIRPHFLFNSMNTIANLTRSQPEQAESTVMDLADLFRATLSTKDSVTLDEEVGLTQRYLRIEALRLGDRLRVDWRIDESVPMDYPIPSLTLQPLVENSIYHGIEPLTEGGTVTVEIRLRDHYLHIMVENPLPPEKERNQRPGNRFAQESIRQRLALAYRGEARMETTQSQERYRVDISLPRRK